MDVRVEASGSATDQRRRFKRPALVTSSESAAASSDGSATFGSSKPGRSSPAGSGKYPALRTASVPPRRSNCTTLAPSPARPAAADGYRGEMSLLRGFIEAVFSFQFSVFSFQLPVGGARTLPAPLTEN